MGVLYYLQLPSFLEKNKENAEKLKRIAEQERKHFEFWRKISRCEPPKVDLKKVKLIAKLLGVQFVLKKMELSEKNAVECYKKIKEMIKDEQLRKELEEILEEEMEHERALMSEVEDPRVKYLGYVALGLADAVVEVTGVHAGFLGATAKHRASGISWSDSGLLRLPLNDRSSLRPS